MEIIPHPLVRANGSLCLNPEFTFDRVRLVSRVPKQRLSQILPLRKLRRRCRYFNLLKIRKGPWKCAIEFPFTASRKFWSQLKKAEKKLGPYIITELELAFDFAANDEDDARSLVQALAQHLRKRWHSRPYILFEYDEGEDPPAGIIQGPTYYFEIRRARTGLKVYARYSKDENRGPVARVEWTLVGTRSIKAKTGITNITQLRGFNSDDFLERHLRFESLDLHTLGSWLTPKSTCPRSVALLYLRYLSYRDPQAESDWSLTRAKWKSTSQLRAHLRTLRKDARKKPGPSSVWDKKLMALTDHRISSFFHKIELS
jgi:hypothetical protein